MLDPSPRVLGQILRAAGVVSEGVLREALEEQRKTRERLGEVLVRRGVESEQVARALATQLRLPFAEPPLAPEPAALESVDRALALRARVVPLALGRGVLRLAMADPLDAAALDDVRFQTGRRVEPVVATPAAVDHALMTAYGAGTVEALLDRFATARASRVRETLVDQDPEILLRASEAPPIVALVDLVLERAVGARASDVHIEPASGTLRVRARVDGLLRELLDLPADAGAAVTSRIKVMAGLDIAVKRRPQDGRGAARVDGRSIGMRVSTLPTDGGEKVVLRLLDPVQAGKPLVELGLAPEAEAGLERLLGRAHGVLLVTGPTGSGKTTTLYAALGTLDRARRNITTLEDPIEYRLSGLTQVQVHRRAGLTFATALRAVLRQDPDVIMVGEMRDQETVEVAMAAALTGHLVLSTLHTNDAPGAVARMVEMGAAPYLVAGGLIGVLAQRLARRLCPHCRADAPADLVRLAALGLPAEVERLPAAVGCARCDGTGFRGRIAVAELLVVDARARRLILRRAGSDALRAAARAAGMRSLAEDAWDKVRAGVTTLEEVAPLMPLLDDGVATPAPRRRRSCGCGR